MQPSFNNGASPAPCPPSMGLGSTSRLGDLRPGDVATIESIDLPHDMAIRLMELGFLPGSRVEAARRAPGGDPHVFRVDGTEIALRRETANHIRVRR